MVQKMVQRFNPSTSAMVCQLSGRMRATHAVLRMQANGWEKA
jgi:hypothetical protein